MNVDVIVIGAGAAGLAAARRLAAHSLRVVVVEARDRVGGRAWSQHLSGAAVPAELGAEFIHGPAAETMALLREMGTAAIDTDGESWTLENGVLRRNDDDTFLAAAALFKEASALDNDESVDQFLQRFDRDQAMREAAQAARSFAEGFDAADPAIASARSIADEWQSGVDSVSARPMDGYRPMFEHLRSMCENAGVQIELGTRVRQIAWRSGDVRVVVDRRGQETRTMRARAAILTLPVGVLRHTDDASEIRFDPPLPEFKRQVLNQIEMGEAVRVVLSFRTAFWESVSDGCYRDAAFFRSAESPFAAYWTRFPVRSGLVVAWAGGPKATALSGLSGEDRIERACDGFGALLGERGRARAELADAVTHDWSRDSFARGAYSYVAVGGTGARQALAVPVADAIFFAGEATSADGQGGTVNGALATGERAAREAARSLGQRLE